ncbi:hypothetical protein EGI22_04110 [Lacihabitans sp. LS3-19]|uniref:hypothetical protein n=1 Tax=Lacihabitans sp. LS3-19 TaxID=2487335 RepID=UPI0020CE7F5E|nr:hypothetical protein [Lacihabitans sp. LS3-19]MCP9767081.1 hypothetical protein [Lacihabitans sp. LS3-19]
MKNPFLKKSIFTVFILISYFSSLGQSAQTTPEGTLIANQNPNANMPSSAILEVRSTNKGVLTPRMTTAQINAISSPVMGLMAYDTDLKCLKTYNGTLWECTGANVVASTPLSSSYAFQSVTDNYAYSKAITADNSGNTISVGSFQGAVTFGKNINIMTLTSAGDYDGYIVKQDADGNLLWATQIAGSANSQEILDVDVDASGNIAVVGFLKGSTTFYSTNGASSSFTTSSNYYSQIFVAKYNSTGVLQWFKTAGSSGSYHCEGRGVAFDGTGNIFLTGFYKGAVSFDGLTFTSISSTDDIFIAKINSAGVYSWIKTAGGTSNTEIGHRVVCDNSNNVYLLGIYSGTATFGETTSTVTYTSRGEFDGFVAKYNSSGTLQWSKTFGSVYEDYTGGICYSSVSNSIYICGSYRSTITFGSGLGSNALAAVGNSIYYYNGYMAKYDLNGNIQWSVRNGNTNSEHSYTNDISTDNSGNPYITGTSRYNTYFYSYNSPNNFFLRGVQYNEPYLAKYSTSGALQWAIMANDGYDESVNGLVVKNNVAYVLGNFKEDLNFGYQQIHATNNSYNGDIFIWRYSE